MLLGGLDLDPESAQLAHEGLVVMEHLVLVVAAAGKVGLNDRIMVIE